MDRRQALRAGIGILVMAAVAACSASAPPSVAPSLALATAAPSPSPTESAAPSAVESAAATDSPAPSTSHKPLPSIDQAELDAYLTSSITLIDLADEGLSVSASYLDPSSNEAIDFGTYELGATEQMTHQVPPGTYRLEFHQPADSTTKQTCTIEISNADAYTFAAVSGAIAIGRTGTKPKDVGDLFVSTSSLCGN